MKLLVTFKIYKGFNSWLKMVDDTHSIMEEMGIIMHWAGTNPEETRIYNIVEVINPEIARGFASRKDVIKAQFEAGVEIESTETLTPISREKKW